MPDSVLEGQNPTLPWFMETGIRLQNLSEELQVQMMPRGQDGLYPLVSNDNV